MRRAALAAIRVYQRHLTSRTARCGMSPCCSQYALRRVPAAGVHRAAAEVLARHRAEAGPKRWERARLATAPWLLAWTVTVQLLHPRSEDLRCGDRKV
jgi:hypothetical protein